VTNQPFTDLLVSKSGHVVVYSLLGWITVDALTAPGAGLGLGRRFALLTTILVGGALAILDETRQSFVYGRTGMASDVVLDALALSGSALLHQWLHRPIGTPALTEAAGQPGEQRAVEDQHQ
jgi:VanZ family protein